MSEIKKEKEEFVGADRLSDLPEDVMIHILSFLDMKQAVQFSLSLKKKWVNLWTLVPDLNFDCSVFENLSSFDRFVDKVLIIRDDSVKINKFSFSGERAARNSTPERASLDVQQLNMNDFMVNSILEDALGCSNSLKSLKLQKFSFYNSLYLEPLVTLHLESVTLSGPGNFSNYPNLRNLTLKRCRSEHGYQFFSPENRIVAPQLSRLMIVNCFKSSVDPKLTLSTPKLVFFSMREFFLPIFQTDELPLLDTVDMNVDLPVGLIYVASEQLVSRLMSMLECFCNVSSISLSWPLIKVLSMFPNTLAREPSPFCNLKSLNIVPSVSHKKTFVTIPGHVTTYLLKNCPDANTVIEIE